MNTHAQEIKLLINEVVFRFYIKLNTLLKTVTSGSWIKSQLRCTFVILYLDERVLLFAFLIHLPWNYWLSVQQITTHTKRAQGSSSGLLNKPNPSDLFKETSLYEILKTIRCNLQTNPEQNLSWLKVTLTGSVPICLLLDAENRD